MADRQWFENGNWHVEALREAVASCQPHTRWHRRDFDPPVADEVVAGFEQRQGVTFPLDYRAFVTQVGGSGAGPGYGLFRFDRSDVGFVGHGWSTFEERTDFYCEPYVHTTSWSMAIPDSDEIDEARLLEDRGTWALADHGCAIYSFLVISGPARAQVWEADTDDFSPESPNFADWYTDWLDSLIGLQSRPTTIRVGSSEPFATETWVERLLVNAIRAPGTDPDLAAVVRDRQVFDDRALGRLNAMQRRKVAGVINRVAEDHLFETPPGSSLNADTVIDLLRAIAYKVERIY